MPPTLLIAGNLRAIDKKDTEKLKSIVPIEYILDWFKQRIGKHGIDNRVLILKSDTGSGKSTVFPAHLYKWMIEANPKVKIAVSQPRVLTTISIVREELIGTGFYPFFKLGENIGWKTGSSRKTVSFGVTYMTVDSLSMQLRTLSDQQIMERFNVIILDEVHELSHGLTYVLYMLKNFLTRNASNPKLPFIVATSATFDINKYMYYFGVGKSSLILVEGSTYPKTEHFADNFSSNFISDIAKLAIKIHKDNPGDDPKMADILAFVPGVAEATKILEDLNNENKTLLANKQNLFLPMFIDREAIIYNKKEHELVFASPDLLLVPIDGKRYKPIRRIILSTNVAETGLTISTLKYVIDSGISREVEYYPCNSVSALVSKPVTMSRFKQRIGRVGRKFPGEFYTLYPKDLLSLFKENQYPDMITADMSSIMLPVLVEQIKTTYNLKKKEYPAGTEKLIELYSLETEPQLNVKDIDLIDGIPPDSLHELLEKLYALGFVVVDDSKYYLTRLGHLCSSFNIKIESARMMMASYAWGCSAADMATIAVHSEFMFKKYKDIQWAIIYQEAVPKHFTLSGDSATIALKLRTTIADTFMDGLFLIRAIQNYLRSADLLDPIEAIKTFCNRAGIQNYRVVIDFIESRDTLIEQIIESGFNPFNVPSIFDQPEEVFNDQIVKMKYCIYEGYRLNMLTYDKDTDSYNSYHGLNTKGPDMILDSIKTFKFTQKPKRILYNTISLASQKNGGAFKVKIDKFSALDGYVNPDDQFINTF